MKREYYEDIGYKPFLFYMIFGVSADELQVSREKHKVDEFPEGLDIASLSRPEHSDYIDSIMGGEIGKILKKVAIVLKKPAVIRQTAVWMLRAAKAKKIALSLPEQYDEAAVGAWQDKYDGILAKLEKKN